MMDIQRSTLWAMSARDSRSPRGDWVWSTKIALPPRVLMPASKLRRVRREAFSKKSTICLASRAWRKSSGWFLTAWASSMMAAISCTVRSAMEQKSRPQRRLVASLKAVSDWMPRVAVGLPCVWSSPAISGFVLIITVLLPMGLLSCRRCAGVCCTNDLVECFDGGLDVFALENERREKTKNGLAGAVGDDVTAHELGSDVFGQVCRTEFEAQHKSDASNVDDVFVARCEFCKLFVEEFADVVDVFEETVSFDGVDDGDCHSTCQRASAESCAMHARGEGFGGGVRAEHCAHGDAVGDWLGNGSDVWKN